MPRSKSSLCELLMSENRRNLTIFLQTSESVQEIGQVRGHRLGWRERGGTVLH